MRRILLAVIVLALTACGDGTLYTNSDKTPQPNQSESEALGSVSITKDAFLFASPYPARIIIPDMDGMRSTAFIVSTLNPSGVLAIDLDTTPYTLSKTFKGVTSPAGTGLPNNLIIQSAARAFMLTSSHVIDFNPTTGAIHAAVALPTVVTVSKPLLLSSPLDYDNDGDTDTSITEIPIRFPGGMTITGDTLWISTANYLRYAPPAVAAPGTVFRYTIGKTGLTPANPLGIITSGYNPTGLAATTNGQVLVTNSGVLNIIDGEAQPATPSSVDFVDAETGALVSTASADLAALSFFVPAVDAGGRFALYGSTAFSEAYQLDLQQRTWTRNLLDPITLSSAASDYITAIALSADGARAYVGSFDQSSIFVLDLASSPITTFPASWSVGFSKGVTPDNPSGVNTGVSDVTVRPGTPGVDFQGPDVFVLTGNPGTLVTIDSYSGAPQKAAPIDGIAVRPAFIPIEAGKQSQATAVVTVGTGQQVLDIHNQFTHPETGQNYRVTWQSDNPKIATVSADGLVTAVASGITTIHATVSGFRADATIAVHQGAAAQQTTPSSNAAPAPSSNPNNSGKLIVVNCKDIGATPFIEQVLSYAVGNGGGANENNLPNIVTGPPNGTGNFSGSTDTFSLGEKGQIIVAFNHCPIADGPGIDFIVFENAFYAGGDPKLPFSEPAIVGVSMDGVNFTDFPCDLNSAPTYPGCAGTHAVSSNPNNGIDPTDPSAAGGDPFDLATVGAKAARFVRIVDQGLTPLKGSNGTNGFDLDAIAVVHGTTTSNNY